MKRSRIKMERRREGVVIDIQMLEYHVLVVLHCPVVLSHLHFLDLRFHLNLNVRVEHLTGEAKPTVVS